MKWNATLGEFLKVQLESENEFHSCSQKSDAVVGHSPKGKTGRLAKTISFFLRGNNEISCKVKVTGKRVSISNWEGLQIPCRLHFTGDAKYISKSKDILAILLQIIFFLCSSIF